MGHRRPCRQGREAFLSFRRLHPLEGLDHELRGLIDAESRAVEDQVIVLRIARVLVEVVLDELGPILVLGVDEPGGLGLVDPDPG